MILTTDGKAIVEANRAAIAMFGQSDTEIVGMKFKDLFSADNSAKVDKELKKLIVSVVSFKKVKVNHSADAEA